MVLDLGWFGHERKGIAQENLDWRGLKQQTLRFRPFLRSLKMTWRFHEGPWPNLQVLAAERGWTTAGGIRAEPSDVIHAVIAAPDSGDSTIQEVICDDYPLVTEHSYGKSPFLMGKSTMNGHVPCQISRGCCTCVGRQPQITTIQITI